MAFDIASMTPLLAQVLMWGMIAYFGYVAYLVLRNKLRKVKKQLDKTDKTMEVKDNDRKKI